MRHVTKKSLPREGISTVWAFSSRLVSNIAKIALQELILLL